MSGAKDKDPNVQPIESILVANRGEIAVRVLRTARSLGLRTVAVYSEADARAPHVAEADEAVLLGPAPVAESYLSIPRILEAAKASGAAAIHPGYGFLSENAEFAAACEAAGLVFIGPTPEAIRAMGNKAESKRLMIAAGVPCVPGYEGEDQADEKFVAAAAGIGFPVMVKAAAGGGGRGMRLVAEPDALVGALALARSEAENAFGSGELILEKAVLRPRHVEVQVFADTHGNVVHFGERDCSVQRRHQKVIEEAPCPVLTEDLRTRMGAAAVEAARSIGYRGAGTVEFLLDGEGNFYFLEMNTRLQVEHPVTELVVGRDLVALQIAVAEGRPLGVAQDEIAMNGHAIEVRLYAEDTTAGFLPSTGTIETWRPAGGEGVRLDAGIAEGGEVSPWYDPMLAKMMAWGPTRDVARRRLVEALRDTALFGTRSNRDFLIAALERETFARGQATTAFIAEEFSDEDLAEPTPGLAELAVAAVLEHRSAMHEAMAAAVTPMTALAGWTSAGRLTSRFGYAVGEEIVEVKVVTEAARPDSYEASAGDRTVVLDCRCASEDRAELVIDGRRTRVVFRVGRDGRTDFSLDGRTWSLTNVNASLAAGADAAGGGDVLAPMHGALLEVLVAVGDRVTRGTRLAVLEAMKMQHEILAEVDGTVAEVPASAGVQVAADALLIRIEVDGAEATDA
jgi:geranyl-CoA carboxylase alpha subunit